MCALEAIQHHKAVFKLDINGAEEQRAMGVSRRERE